MLPSFSGLLIAGFLTKEDEVLLSGSELKMEPTWETTSFIKVRVHPSWLKSLTVSFDLPSFWDISYVNILKSGAEQGPYQKINDVPVTDNWFKDVSKYSHSKFDQDFYIVEVGLVNGLVYRSVPVSWENVLSGKQFKIANEIHRREWLLLRKFTGVKSLIFPRRSYGPRCPVCYDTAAGKITKEHCTSCFGSGFHLGFWNPIPTLMQYGPTPNQSQKTVRGESEPNQIMAWTIADPQINPFDVIVRLSDMSVYEVGQINVTELRTVRIKQDAVLIELARADTEYKLVDKILKGEYSQLGGEFDDPSA